MEAWVSHSLKMKKREGRLLDLRVLEAEGTLLELHVLEAGRKAF